MPNNDQDVKTFDARLIDDLTDAARAAAQVTLYVASGGYTGSLVRFDAGSVTLAFAGSSVTGVPDTITVDTNAILAYTIRPQ